MTKTFTPKSFKNLSNSSSSNLEENSEEKFYHAIYKELNKLVREPSEETIAKILKHAVKR